MHLFPAIALCWETNPQRDLHAEVRFCNYYIHRSQLSSSAPPPSFFPTALRGKWRLLLLTRKGSGGQTLFSVTKVKWRQWQIAHSCLSDGRKTPLLCVKTDTPFCRQASYTLFTHSFIRGYFYCLFHFFKPQDAIGLLIISNKCVLCACPWKYVCADCHMGVIPN